MKKIYIHLMMLAAMVVAGATMVSCSKDETITGKFNMTVKASKGGGNAKVLSLGGTTLSATWAVGEQVKVYKEEAEIGTLTAQSAGESTTLDGTITGTITPDDVLTLKFCSPNYTSQLGTLEYIAANCDYATATVTVASNDNGRVTTTDHADFVNQQAIVKFTLKDKEDNSINTTKLVVTVGTDDYTITPARGTDEIFIAIPGFSGQTVTLSADIADIDHPYYFYSLQKDGVTFNNSQYYEYTVKMARCIDLARMTTETSVTAQNGDVITGTLSYLYHHEEPLYFLSIAAGATVTLRDAVAYRYALTCEGNATITLEGENILDVSNGYGTSGIYVPSGSKLTIQGSGSLTARGAEGCAGIGANSGNACGNIVINSGTVNAYGKGNYGAGIGGTQHSCGTITITGGEVNAEGAASYGAGSGYGSGYGSGNVSSCGVISITGGTVTAKGGQYGAGIGSGYRGVCSDISITGGTITAIGDWGGSSFEIGGSAGIGSGLEGACGDITITNTVTSVTATAQYPYYVWQIGNIYGCCIGKGYSASCGTVTIPGEESSDCISNNTHTYTYPSN